MNNWQTKKIEDLITNEGLFVDGDWVESKDQDPNGEVRLIQLADIGEGKFINKSNRYLTKRKAEELNCTFLNKGDILFSRLGEPLGKSTLFPQLPGGHVTVVDIAIVRPNNREINNKLLVYLFNSPLFRADVEKLKSGTTRKRISRKNLSKIEFKLPTKELQDKLVENLDSLFSKIDAGEEGLQQVEKQLEVYRQAVLKKVFDGEVSWTTIGKVSDVSGGLTKSSKRNKYSLKLPYLRVANVYENRLQLDDVQTIGLADTELERVLLQKNDLLIVEGNGSISQIGRVALWDGSIEKCVHQNHIIKVRLNKAKMDPKFVLYFLMSVMGRKSIIKQASSTSGLHTLSLSKVSNLRIPMFSLKKQEDIAEYIEESLSIITALVNQVEQSRNLTDKSKQSILKKAFNGELI